MAAVAMAAAVVAMTVPAVGAITDPDVAAAAAMDQGYYIEPGADADEASISTVVSEARNQGIRLNVIILVDDPAGGATAYADAVLDRLEVGTVIVLTAEQNVGVASTEFTFEELDAALDAADAVGGDDATYVAAFAAALSSLAAGESAEEVASGGSGGGGLVIFLVIIAALVGLVAWLVWRQKKKTDQRRLQQVADAKQELRAQLDAVANDVLALSDRPGLSNVEAASDHYTAASATYAEAEDALGKAETLGELEDLAEQIDQATWQLDAAEALLDGNDEPPKPEPRRSLRCFFDPTHPGPMEDAEIESATGKTTVRVCKRDGDRLRQGSSPEPRMVRVGGNRVPAATAPRSTGGGGIGGLDVFSILVGGMAAGAPQRWGGMDRRTQRASSSANRSASRTRASSPTRSRASRSISTTRARTGRRRKS